MADRTSSASTSPSLIVGQLEQVRDAARMTAADSLNLAHEADRAIEAVQWGADTGYLKGFPSVYSTSLNQALSDLTCAGTAISSAHSNVQMTISGSTSAAVGGALVSEVFKPLQAAAPAFHRDSAQENLDQLLTWISGDTQLAERRQGAWVTLQLGTSECAAQACHTLREILTALLDRFASVQDVQQAPWWRHVADTKDGVSKRQKIRYLMVCSDDTEIDEDLVEELTNQVDRAMSAHQLTIKYAHHQQDVRTSSARLAMVDLEEVMLTLLSFRRSLGRC